MDPDQNKSACFVSVSGVLSKFSLDIIAVTVLHMSGLDSQPGNCSWSLLYCTITSLLCAQNFLYLHYAVTYLLSCEHDTLLPVTNSFGV